MNILLLGETGAGKSTFINGLSTYFTYPTLDDALKNPFNPIIPIKFEVAGSTVRVGLDKNESGEPGKSCTQHPRTYVLGWNGIAVRILDTPGIGDTRGVDKDQENFTMILDHIKAYNYIHGICILLKSGQSRLTPFFQSCIKQLLAHLHQDAINNIVFVVTHGAPNFEPATSIATLQSLLDKDLPNVGIELGEKTVYCVDNEAVKYLAQKSANVPFQKETRSRRAADDSWEETYEQMYRLFSYFQMLAPHDTTKTYSLNQTREICLALGGPLAENTTRILETQADIRRQKDEVLKTLQDGLHLQSAQTTSTKVFRNVTDNKYTWLVCNSEKCSRTVNDRGTELFIPGYCKKQERDFLSAIMPSQVFKGLGILTAGTGALVNCSVCSCSSWHHSLTYEKVLEENIDVINPEVQRLVKEKASKAEVQKAVVEESEKDIRSLEIDVEYMRKVQVMAGQFLKQNSIFQTADAYLDRLKLIMDEEKSKFPKGESPKVEKLEQLVREYEMQKEKLKVGGNGPQTEITLEEIKSSLAKLYELPSHGKAIQKAVEDKMMASVKGNDEIFHSPSLRRYGLPDKKIASFMDLCKHVARK